MKYFSLDEDQVYALKSWKAAYEHLGQEAMKRGLKFVPYTLLQELINEMDQTLNDFGAD